MDKVFAIIQEQYHESEFGDLEFEGYNFRGVCNNIDTAILCAKAIPVTKFKAQYGHGTTDVYVLEVEMNAIYKGNPFFGDNIVWSTVKPPEEDIES